jgi:hypothetical protein
MSGDSQAEDGLPLANRSVDTDQEETGGTTQTLLLENPEGKRAANSFKL